MASLMKDDYVEYDFSDEELFNSSDDEDASGHLESWLKTKLSRSGDGEKRLGEKDGCSSESAASFASLVTSESDQYLTNKQIKKLSEKEFEQCMENALDDLESLDQAHTLDKIDNKSENNEKMKGSGENTSSSKKRVKFLNKVSTENKSEEGQQTGEQEVNNDSEFEDGDDDDELLSREPDPFYDPEMDDVDEKWMKDEIRKHYPKVNTNSSSKHPDVEQSIGSSDAILSCPACMSIVCIDCQRHAFYPNQFRAMFAMNCRIADNEILNVTESSNKKSKSKSRKGKHRKMDNANESSSSSSNSNNSSCIFAEGMNCSKQSVEQSLHQNGSDSTFSGQRVKLGNDQFHPVKCDVCTTEVGVYDKDEVYHFFNIITSLS